MITTMEQLYETLDPNSTLATIILENLTNGSQWEDEAVMVKAGQTFSKYLMNGQRITVLELYFEGLYTWQEVVDEVIN